MKIRTFFCGVSCAFGIRAAVLTWMLEIATLVIRDCSQLFCICCHCLRFKHLYFTTESKIRRTCRVCGAQSIIIVEANIPHWNVLETFPVFSQVAATSCCILAFDSACYKLLSLLCDCCLSLLHDSYYSVCQCLIWVLLQLYHCLIRCYCVGVRDSSLSNTVLLCRCTGLVTV